MKRNLCASCSHFLVCNKKAEYEGACSATASAIEGSKDVVEVDVRCRFFLGDESLLRCLSKDDINKVGIEELDLSVRSYNCLSRAGCKTVGDICCMTHDDLCRVRNLGRHSVDEIIKVLSKYGLALKEAEQI